METLGAVPGRPARPEPERNHDRRGPQARRLRHRLRRQMAPGDQPQFLPTSPGIRFLLRHPLFQRHVAALYAMAIPGPAHPAQHRSRRSGGHDGRSSHAVPAIHGRGRGFHQGNREKPFFLYLPHDFVHHPRNASKKFMDKAGTQREFDEKRMVMESRYAGAQRTRAQIEEVDSSVGCVLDCLRELGLSDNTMVLFTSDNGGASGCCNLPLRGGKATIWEGGMREPTVAWWPGTIPAGDQMRRDHHLHGSAADAGGIGWGPGSPTDRVIDGKDICDLLQARPRRQVAPRPVLLLQKNGPGGRPVRSVEAVPQRPTLQLSPTISVRTTAWPPIHPRHIDRTRLTQYNGLNSTARTEGPRTHGPLGGSRIQRTPRCRVPLTLRVTRPYAPTLSLPQKQSVTCT